MEYMKRLGYIKNYMFNEFYDEDTGESLDIKNIKKIVVNYYVGETKEYELFHDIQYVRDMGCSGEIINPFVFEDFKGITSRIYVTSILSFEGNEVFVVDSKPPKQL